MNEILRWLNTTRDYQIGIEILKKHSKNTFLIMSLELGKDSYNENRLRKELETILERFGGEKEKETTKAEIVVKELQLKPSEQLTAIDEIKEVIYHRKKLYNEAKKLHARLEYYTDENECKEACFRLVELWKEINQLWKISNFYDANNRMPNRYEQELTIELEALSDMELNKRYLKNYKFLQKNKAVLSKKQDFENILKETTEIKEILIVRDAFCYQKYTIPNFAAKDE